MERIFKNHEFKTVFQIFQKCRNFSEKEGRYPFKANMYVHHSVESKNQENLQLVGVHHAPKDASIYGFLKFAETNFMNDWSKIVKEHYTKEPAAIYDFVPEWYLSDFPGGPKRLLDACKDYSEALIIFIARYKVQIEKVKTASKV